jgi:hypothetical protein
MIGSSAGFKPLGKSLQLVSEQIFALRMERKDCPFAQGDPPRTIAEGLHR